VAWYILAMNRKQAIKLFAASLFVGLMAGIGTHDLGYGTAGFVVTFLGWGGWELLRERRP
jgi:hypothetical protein